MNGSDNILLGSVTALSLCFPDTNARTILASWSVRPLRRPVPIATRRIGRWTLEPLSLPDMFERAAGQWPNAPLIDFFGRKFSYAEIADLARRVATGLAGLGIRSGDRVGLYLPNVPYYVAAYFGALRLGAVLVNLSPLGSQEEIREQVDDSGVRLIFTLDAASLLPQAMALLGAGPLERVVVGSVARVLPKGRGLLYHLAHRSERAAVPVNPRVTPFPVLVANDGTVPRIGVDPERDVALLQYSGGTTDEPRAAMLTHNALTANARQIDAADPYSPSRGRGDVDRVLGALPLFHIFANICVLNRTVVAGGEMVLLPRFEPGEVIAAIERTRATKMPGVPNMYQALLDHPAMRKADLSSLRLCISGGAALPAALKERFERETGALLVEGYGLTEGGMLCANPVAALNKSGTMGQPLPATRVALVDREIRPGIPSPASPARSSWPGRRSCWAIGAGRRTRPSCSGTGGAGCVPVTSVRSTRTAMSGSSTGSRRSSRLARSRCFRARSRPFLVAIRRYPKRW